MGTVTPGADTTEQLLAKWLADHKANFANASCSVCGGALPIGEGRAQRLFYEVSGPRVEYMHWSCVEKEP